MVITMLEAETEPGQANKLVEGYREITAGGLSEQLLETFLLHQDGSNVWRVVTLWRGKQDLLDYRESVETPDGVLIFRAAGAEPELKIFDVVERVTA